MAAFQDLWEEAGRLGPAPAEDCVERLSKFAPPSTSLAELSHAAESRTGKRSDLLAILACLRHGDRLCVGPADSVSARHLAHVVAHLIAPVSSWSGCDGGDETSGLGDDVVVQDPYGRVSEHCRDVAYAGLQAIELLRQRMSDGVGYDDQTLITLAAFTDASEAWAADRTAELAQHVLELERQKLSDAAKERFIVEAILREYLRPLFSRSRPTTVTESGRKAEYRDHDLERERGLPDESARTKPWKYEDLRAIPVLSWAISHAHVGLIRKSWPLFVPVLLTLLDDPATRVRARGLALTTDFLLKFPSETLRDTGLADVFEQAVSPTLNFLPSLTPEDESVQLLDPAFRALRVLSDKVSLGPDPTGGNKLRDKILRDGIFMTYFHAREHPRIVEVLFQQTAAVVGELKIHAVKHLKDIIPMLSSAITDPFALSQPPTALAATAALQATIANCWPRLGQGIWQDELIKTLTIGWLHLTDDAALPTPEAAAVAEIRAGLARAAKMLAAVAGTGDVRLTDKVAPLLSREPELASLFAADK